MARSSSGALSGVGVGRPYGYGGDDVVGVAEPYARGEVTKVTDDVIVELRVHGVGGATAEANLGVAHTLQVAGDASAGFFRAWFPGLTKVPPVPSVLPTAAAGPPLARETYCWGKLDYAGWPSALWLLLLPFALVNVAHWMLPAPEGKGRLSSLEQAVLRVLALSLTSIMVGAAGFVLVDLVGWQSTAKPHQKLPSWAGALQHVRPGVVVAATLLGVLVLVIGLRALSMMTSCRYERWDGGTGDEALTEMRLGQSGFWDAEETLVRQRHCHIAIGLAVLYCYCGLVMLPVHSGIWHQLAIVALAVAGVIAALSVVLVASRPMDRLAYIEGHKDPKPGPRTGGPGLVPTLALANSRTALWLSPVAIVLTGFCPIPSTHAAIPGDLGLQSVLVAVAPLLVLVLAVLVWRHHRASEAMLKGFAAPVVALSGTLIAAAFGGSVTMTVANLLGSPRTHKTADASRTVFVVPRTVFAGGLVLLVGLAVVLLSAAVLWRLWKRLSKGAMATLVAGVYGPGSPDETCPSARQEVARTWALSRLTDSAPYALAATVSVTAVTLLVALASSSPVVTAGWRSWWARWMSAPAEYGATLGLLVFGVILTTLRQSLTATASRKKLSFFWDVVTFWPRAVHPLGPPCYAERSVPELVYRIRTITGDESLTHDHHRATPSKALQLTESGAFPYVPSINEVRTGLAAGLVEPPVPVLLSGYSQGAPISVAVVAQLPPQVRARVALLTLASPVRRLYGRSFPAYFGNGELESLRTSLDKGQRWTNLVRDSDYVGGWVFGDRPAAAGAVDQWIVDPPALWPDASPIQVPIHLHSDWFIDPQTYPYAAQLADRLMHLPAPAVPPQGGPPPDPPGGGDDPGGSGGDHGAPVDEKAP